MIKNGSVEPTSWKLVGLAILPGIWLVLQHSTSAPFDVSFFREAVTLTVTIVVALSLVLVSLHGYHRVEAWCLPAFGAVIWKVDEFLRWWNWADAYGTEPAWRVDMILEHSGVWSIAYRSALVLGVLGLGIFMACSVALWLWRVSKSGSGIPRWSWALVGVLIVMTCGSVGLFLFPLFAAAAGSLWAKRAGLGASLLVLACVPQWVTFTSVGGGLYSAFFEAVRQQSATLTQLGLLLSAAIYLLFLCFLIGVPIGLLRSRSKRQQLLWLLILPFVTLMGIASMSLFGLQGLRPDYDDALYSTGQVILALASWLPLPLTAVLYDSQQRHPGFVPEH